MDEQVLATLSLPVSVCLSITVMCVWRWHCYAGVARELQSFSDSFPMKTILHTCELMIQTHTDVCSAQRFAFQSRPVVFKLEQVLESPRGLVKAHTGAPAPVIQGKTQEVVLLTSSQMMLMPSWELLSRQWLHSKGDAFSLTAAHWIWGASGAGVRGRVLNREPEDQSSTAAAGSSELGNLRQVSGLLLVSSCLTDTRMGWSWWLLLWVFLEFTIGLVLLSPGLCFQLGSHIPKAPPHESQCPLLSTITPSGAGPDAWESLSTSSPVCGVQRAKLVPSLLEIQICHFKACLSYVCYLKGTSAQRGGHRILEPVSWV